MTPEQLKKIRSKSGLSQTKFAEKIYMSKDQVSKMERGERTITKKTAALVRLLFCAKKSEKK